MATGGKRFCDLCEVQHLSNEAELWCPQCEEALCSSCKVQHGIQRITKNHSIIPIEDYNQLPESVQKIKLHCEEHGERFEYFCSSHDVPCCVKCIKSDHRDCKETLTPLHEVAENAKFSKVTLDLERYIKDIQDNMQNVLDIKAKNMESLNQQKIKCQKEIQAIRQELNKRIDNLEEGILNELSAAFKKHESEIKDLIYILNAKKQKIDESEKVIALVKKDATDLQAYLCIREMTKVTKEEGNYLELLMDTNTTVKLDLEFASELDHIKTNFPLCGKLNIEIKKDRLVYMNRAKQGAQILNPRRLMGIDEIKLTKKIDFNIPQEETKTEVLDCLITANGQFVFPEINSKSLIIFEVDGKFRRTVQLLHSPSRLLQMNNSVNDILIIYQKECIIHSFELTNYQVVSQINLKRKPTSISQCENNILVGFLNFGFQIMNKSGNVLHEIEVEFGKAPYAAVSNNRIYYTSYKDHNIICIDMKGNVVFEVNNESIRCPIGIQTNDDGHLFVTGFHSGNIMAISGDGLKFRELVKMSNASNLRAINYNHNLKLLVVATEDGKVFVYDIV